MIHLGRTPAEKTAIVRDYCQGRDITRVVVLSPEKFDIAPGVDARHVDWPEIIMYRTFYPLLQEIDARTLVVVNECLRTQNRHDLTYNCIRHYLNQAGHALVFQWLPIIDSIEDFMILFDFDTSSRWKRERFDEGLLAECGLSVTLRTPMLAPVTVPVDDKTRALYQHQKTKLFAELGNKDPHTIPRNLYLISGKAKLPHIQPFAWHVGRNTRFKLDQIQTYKEPTYPHAPYTVFEFPHNFIDFSDFLALAQMERAEALVADLAVDRWYFERYTNWTQRVDDAYASLSAR